MIRLNSLIKLLNLAILFNWESKRLKRITMNYNIIKTVVRYCDTHVSKDAARNVIMKWTGDGGYYYCLIAKYADLCRNTKGLDSPDGLPCFECRQIIYDGQNCVSMAKSNGKKYFHPQCAWKLNII